MVDRLGRAAAQTLGEVRLWWRHGGLQERTFAEGILDGLEAHLVAVCGELRAAGTGGVCETLHNGGAPGIPEVKWPGKENYMKKKKAIKKLTLSSETLRQLTTEQEKAVYGAE